MITLQTRSFLLGKDNEPEGRQDALSVNDTTAMYAVADGVSNSFHPEILSRILCDTFVNLTPDILSDWEEYSDEILLPMLNLRWNTYAERYLSSLSGRLLRHETINYERWRMGASTFCGVYIDRVKSQLHYFIIGDSTLFVHTCENVLEFNSSPKSTAEEGEEKTDFSNVTSAILSDGTLSGAWMVGELSMDGIDRIALMTDGMAKWYQNMHLKNLDPFEILWDLKDMDEFCVLANKVRTEEMEMDDDLAVILIRKVASDFVMDNLGHDEEATDIEKLDSESSVSEEESEGDAVTEGEEESESEKQSEAKEESTSEEEPEAKEESASEEKTEEKEESASEEEPEAKEEPETKEESECAEVLEAEENSRSEENTEREASQSSQEVSDSKVNTLSEDISENKSNSDAENGKVSFLKRMKNKLSEKIK